jgi:uncharacterized membrane protein YtjA (UPF0391 family)
MLGWPLVFLCLALIGALLGYGGVMDDQKWATDFYKTVFVLFSVLFALSLLFREGKEAQAVTSFTAPIIDSLQVSADKLDRGFDSMEVKLQVLQPLENPEVLIQH